jgi:hypothetical protein
MSRARHSRPPCATHPAEAPYVCGDCGTYRAYPQGPVEVMGPSRAPTLNAPLRDYIEEKVSLGLMNKLAEKDE